MSQNCDREDNSQISLDDDQDGDLELDFNRGIPLNVPLIIEDIDINHRNFDSYKVSNNSNKNESNNSLLNHHSDNCSTTKHIMQTTNLTAIDLGSEGFGDNKNFLGVTSGAVKTKNISSQNMHVKRMRTEVRKNHS